MTKSVVLLACMLCSGHLLVSAQDNGHLQELIDQHAQAIEALQARVEAQQATISQQQTTLQSQASSIHTLQTSLSLLQAKQSHAVAFYADLGDDGDQDYRPKDMNVSANAPVIFSVALTNVGDAYSTKTGYFTAPFSGLYFFHLHFMGGAYNDTTQLDIVATGPNGPRFLGMAYAVGNQIDEEDQGSGTAVCHLERGSTVHVQSSYYDAMIWASALSSFSGMLVHAD